MHFSPDGRLGCVIGRSDTVMTSYDSGTIWQVGTTGTGMSLWNVRVLSERDSWVVGDEGTVLSTADGAAHWDQRFYGPEKDAAARR
ncbi:hypothetical protein [Streptomyces graminilatus]|uniref:hypothetical protein n=1 Tax=Streptomyces graminilatus TaxID=1464070 RepID=UPI0006E2686B|nr:hypothetical protein [Streptomyces graminilatus]